MDAIWNSVHQERAALIRDLHRLSPDDWGVESLCQGWRIRDVVAHLLDTATTTPTSFLTGMARAGFNFDRQNEFGLERYRSKEPEELISLLEQVRNRTSGPPRFLAPLATRLVEEIAHGEDIRRPLGLHRDYQPEDLKTAITYQAATSTRFGGCLLYTSDAADERSSVDLGGRRIIKKKNKPHRPEEHSLRYTTLLIHTTQEDKTTS